MTGLRVNGVAVHRPRPRIVAAVTLFAVLALSPSVAAPFDSVGHDVLEALAYRALVEGYRGQPPRPEVLRDLINDGALKARRSGRSCSSSTGSRRRTSGSPFAARSSSAGAAPRSAGPSVCLSGSLRRQRRSRPRR